MRLHWMVAVAMFAADGGEVRAQGTDGFRAALDSGQPSPWRFQVSGLVSHFKDPECENCSYRTSVPGIGLRRDMNPARSPLGYAISAGVQNDSFGDSGGYAAVSTALDLPFRSLVFKPGLGAFAFYRYMDHRSDRSGGREFVPAILPMLSVEEARSGIGATLLVAPNFSFGGRDRSGFVFVQMTFRLGRDATSPSRASPSIQDPDAILAVSDPAGATGPYAFR
jgi:hypothetical protein